MECSSKLERRKGIGQSIVVCLQNEGECISTRRDIREVAAMNRGSRQALSAYDVELVSVSSQQRHSAQFSSCAAQRAQNARTSERKRSSMTRRWRRGTVKRTRRCVGDMLPGCSLLILRDRVMERQVSFRGLQGTPNTKLWQPMVALDGRCGTNGCVSPSARG